VVLGLTLGRQIDQDVAAVRVQLQELRHWVEELEETVRTNRLTRMAPETRAEIDALRRELAAAQGRIEALERTLGRR
jgi:predicted RNase H-like nuclease (RuvC/YqgF family)